MDNGDSDTRTFEAKVEQKVKGSLWTCDDAMYALGGGLAVYVLVAVLVASSAAHINWSSWGVIAVATIISFIYWMGVVWVAIIVATGKRQDLEYYRRTARWMLIDTYNPGTLKDTTLYKHAWQAVDTRAAIAREIFERPGLLISMGEVNPSEEADKLIERIFHLARLLDRIRLTDPSAARDQVLLVRSKIPVERLSPPPAEGVATVASELNAALQSEMEAVQSLMDTLEETQLELQMAVTQLDTLLLRVRQQALVNGILGALVPSGAPESVN